MNFFDCKMNGNANSLFWSILKTFNLNIRLWNQLPIRTGQLEKLRHWFKTFRFLFLIWLNVSLNYFCFWKRKNILQRVLKKKIIEDLNLLWGYCILPWDREIWVKTARLSAKPWDLVVLKVNIEKVTFVKKDNAIHS